MTDEPQFSSLEQLLHDSTTTKALQRFLQKGENGQSFYGQRDSDDPKQTALRIDGIAGRYTRKGLQEWLGVEPDGIIGPKTIAALKAKLPGLNPSSSEADITTALAKKLADGGFDHASKAEAAPRPAATSQAQPPVQPPAGEKTNLVPPGPSPGGGRQSLRGQATPPALPGSSAETAPEAGRMLVYYDRSGTLVDPATNQVLAMAVSGNSKGWNNPDDQKRNEGALPVGMYKLSARHWSAHLQRYEIDLDPMFDTNRKLLRMHNVAYQDRGPDGQLRPASHGCMGLLPGKGMDLDGVAEYLRSNQITHLRVVPDAYQPRVAMKATKPSAGLVG
jgi:peptidoglycan hydrolase-like protein with peptidoglycan-binding domain